MFWSFALPLAVAFAAPTHAGLVPCAGSGPWQVHLVPQLALAAEQQPGGVAPTPAQPPPPAPAPARPVHGGPMWLEVAAGAGAGLALDALAFSVAYVALGVTRTGFLIDAVLGIAITTGVLTLTLAAVPLVVTFVEAWMMGGDAPPFAYAAAAGLGSAVQVVAAIVTIASALSALPPLLAFAGMAFGALISLAGVPVAASWGLHAFAPRAPTRAAAASAAGRELESPSPSLPVAALSF